MGCACPLCYELIKLPQVRRQLEYSIAESKGERLVKPPNTLQAVSEIFKRGGVTGLYTGFRLHCRMFQLCLPSGAYAYIHSERYSGNVSIFL